MKTIDLAQLAAVTGGTGSAAAQKKAKAKLHVRKAGGGVSIINNQTPQEIFDEVKPF
jgi:hypothetical protein